MDPVDGRPGLTRRRCSPHWRVSPAGTRVGIIVGWLAVLVCGALFGPSTLARLTTDETGDRSVESVAGLVAFRDASPHGPQLTAIFDGVDAGTPSTVTDYEVFLLARVKESHGAGFGNDDAVATGLQRSGRIIT